MDGLLYYKSLFEGQNTKMLLIGNCYFYVSTYNQPFKVMETYVLHNSDADLLRKQTSILSGKGYYNVCVVYYKKHLM